MVIIELRSLLQYFNDKYLMAISIILCSMVEEDLEVALSNSTHHKFHTININLF